MWHTAVHALMIKYKSNRKDKQPMATAGQWRDVSLIVKKLLRPIRHRCAGLCYRHPL